MEVLCREEAVTARQAAMDGRKGRCEPANNKDGAGVVMHETKNLQKAANNDVGLANAQNIFTICG